MTLVDQYNDGASALRNKVPIIVLYRRWLGISEALGIRSSDYNPTEGTIRVIGKGNKMRVFTKKTARLLQGGLFL
ncbi:MAG: hypothetical protein EBS96_10125 [Spartobacteria bacterium]|nr:hypothetical protein [Spartobacteria bacterium]